MVHISENFKGGVRAVAFYGSRSTENALRCGRVRPRGYRFQRPPAERSEAPPMSDGEAPPSEARPSPPSEARLHRAKRGSTEAPPSEARPREGHREVAITKKLKKVPPPESFLFYRGSLIKILFSKNNIMILSQF